MAKQDNTLYWLLGGIAALAMLSLQAPQGKLPFGAYRGIYKGNTVIITHEGKKYTFKGNEQTSWPIEVIVRVNDIGYTIAVDKDGGAVIGRQL